MGHQQPETPLQTDSSTASDIENETICYKYSKFIDMRFYWLKDCVRQGQFNVFWRPGPTNLAYNNTKHHTAPHHCNMCSTFLPYNPLTSKAKFLKQIVCEGVLITSPRSPYPEVTWRLISSNSLYVCINVPHANICSRLLATYNLACTNLQVI